MKLLVIAYPELSDKDFKLIESYREENDKMFHIVRSHFTFVFPVADISIPDFADEIKKQVKGINSISFSIRCATINKDAFSECYHVFLVPDEGFSQMEKVHDKLYSDKLSKHLKLDIDYIPHITITASPDKLLCKKIADEWNSKKFLVSRKISDFDIVQYQNKKVTTIEKVHLDKL